MVSNSGGDSAGSSSDFSEQRDVTTGGVTRKHPLGDGVDALCDRLTSSVGLDGAAMAILTGSLRIRELVYATDEVAQQLDELQFVLGEGPCLDAFVKNWPQLWAHLDTTISVDAIWPGFALEAINLGARALFAFPVPGDPGPIGVLELYRRSAGTMQPFEVRRAKDCAVTLGAKLLGNWRAQRDHAAGIDPVADDGEESSDAVNPFTRSAVHIAAGMTAVQLGISPAEGLDRLRAYAYAQRRSIAAVAGDIIGRRLSLKDQKDQPGA